MTLLQENIMEKINEKELLKEGVLTKGRFHVWYEELPGLAKALVRLQASAKKYIAAVKKDHKSGLHPEMDYPGNMALEISFESQPILGTHIFKKEVRGKTWIKISLSDGNGVAPHLLKPNKYGNYIVDEITINTKLELSVPPSYVK
jgi:hypothetical protein